MGADGSLKIIWQAIHSSEALRCEVKNRGSDDCRSAAAACGRSDAKMGKSRNRKRMIETSNGEA